MRWAVALWILAWCSGFAAGAELGEVPRYHVVDIVFTGPRLEAAGLDLRRHDLWVEWTHESGVKLSQYGFWDGEDRFVVRFCPPLAGQWRITQATGTDLELRGQRVGDTLRCKESKHPGYWIAEGHWFRRSDGSRPYIVGNTHYTLLSRRGADGVAIPGTAAEDITANAACFNKVRFSLMGDRYVDPHLKPFLDELGRPTDSGRFSHRPNPRWFRERVDPAVRAGFKADVICDLILSGPDTADSRSAMSNPGPWLAYVAARYGSFPNVWLCLSNEWDIKQPRYEANVFMTWGESVKLFQPRSPVSPRVPVSVHGSSGPWPAELNDGGWNTHVIIQRKARTMAAGADAAEAARRDGGGKPVVNDENAYQGGGDGFSEADTLAGCVGTFLGGGYPTTGEKHGEKRGQYFWGGFDRAVHTAAPRLAFFRRFVDGHPAFWKMSPAKADDVFRDAPQSFRMLAEDGRQYVLGSDTTARVTADLPPGRFRVVQADVAAMTVKTIGEAAQGVFTFETPASRSAVTCFVRME